MKRVKTTQFFDNQLVNTTKFLPRALEFINVVYWTILHFYRSQISQIGRLCHGSSPNLQNLLSQDLYGLYLLYFFLYFHYNIWCCWELLEPTVPTYLRYLTLGISFASFLSLKIKTFGLRHYSKCLIWNFWWVKIDFKCVKLIFDLLKYAWVDNWLNFYN